MKGQWMIWLLVTGLVYVSGNICDKEHAETCYMELVRYETRAFPLYDQGTELKDTCDNINASSECIQKYVDTCHGSPECDVSCQEFIQVIFDFKRYTGLKVLAEQLCDEHSVVRHNYLSVYHCLEGNSNLYSACHNKSEISMIYIYTITNHEAIPARCCFLTWFYDCFVNITRDYCGRRATDYVTFGLTKLVGHLTNKICTTSDATCSSPPLPPDEDGNVEPDKANKDDETHEDKDDINKDKEVEDTVGTNKNKQETSSASIIPCSLAETAFVLHIILFINLLIY